MKYCSNCGFELQKGANACSNCGKMINGNNQNHIQEEGKSRLAAGLFGLFLGGWGIHNFYLGYTNKGIAQLILTILSCGIAGVWGFIEGILILAGSINTDAEGNPLKD